MSTVLITGGFDPLHSGHIEYIKAARQLGDHLVVGLNSDEWLTRKKGRPFLPFTERKTLLENIKGVERVFGFDDSDESAKDAIRKAKEPILTSDGGTGVWSYRGPVIFANGGDRDAKNTPEYDKYKDDPNVIFAFNVGSSIKKNSSSDILEAWTSELLNKERLIQLEEIKKSNPNPLAVFRKWGYYTVLYDTPFPECLHLPNYKVKELNIRPQHTITLQKHNYRSEFWFCVEGEVRVQQAEKMEALDLSRIFERGVTHWTKDLKQHDYVDIKCGMWHRASNPHNKRYARVIEIQYGEKCEESDIERPGDYK